LGNQLRTAGAQAVSRPPATPRPATAEPAPVRPQPAPAAAASTTYRVERGDTLSRIAAKVYNDSGQWQRIFEANRNILSTPESLREGQMLTIPQP